MLTQYLAKKFEQAFLRHVRRDGWEIAFCLLKFFARKRLLASENGLYELASTFYHAGHDQPSKTTQCSSLTAALLYIRTGIASLTTLRLST